MTTTISSGTDDPPSGASATRDAVAEPLRPAWRPRRRGMARWAPIVATLLVIVGVIAVTLWQLHPNLLLSDTSTTGGDTGAHYMMPAYFTSDLFPHLTGWDPAWYDGYPIYTFYFVLPDALVALASHVITYNVAFKLATVLGSVLLPIAAWACGRLFRLRPPIPAALAAVTLPFLFDYTYTIYGGNLFSTLAGEYAYSLSIALAVLFLGLMARGLRTGRYRGWAAVVLALCIVSHIVPAMLALVGAGLLTAFELLPERLRLHDDGTRPSSAVSRPPGREGVRGRWPAVWWGVSTTAIGVLLSGWWLVPFGIRQPYSTSMGYANVTTYATLLFPHADLWALVLAGVAVVVAVLRRSRFGLLFGLLGGLSAVALIVDPQASLYNVRFLPLWFLCVYLMAGWVFGVGVAAAARWWRRARLSRWVWTVRSATEPSPTDPAAGDAAAGDGAVGGAPVAGDAVAYGWWRRPPSARWAPGAVGGALLALFGALVVVVPPFIPAVASALPDVGITPGANEVTNWAEWNYTGYEGKAGLSGVPGGRRADGQGRPEVRLRSGDVGVQRRREPLRHARGADAAAVLDERLRRLDGGTAVRVVDDDAVPLPQPGRAVARTRRSRWSACRTGRSTSRSASSTCRCWGSSTSWPPARRSSRRPTRTRRSNWSRRPARGRRSSQASRCRRRGTSTRCGTPRSSRR